MIRPLSISELISIMMKAPILSEKDLADLWRRDEPRRLAAIERMLETGESYGVTSNE